MSREEWTFQKHKVAANQICFSTNHQKYAGKILKMTVNWANIKETYLSENEKKKEICHNFGLFYIEKFYWEITIS